MAFVNQRGFLVDKAEWSKYNDSYVMANNGKGSLGSGNWTIDRERGLLLVCLRVDRQDMYEGDFEHSWWAFYWHGFWVKFEQNDYGNKVSESHWKMNRVIKNFTMPDAIKRDVSRFYADLKEAFESYRLIGAGGDGKEYFFELVLDVSEVQ